MLEAHGLLTAHTALIHSVGLSRSQLARVHRAGASIVWSPRSNFELYGQTILRHEGRLTTEDGTLAGADLDLPAAIRNCLSLLGLELEEALRMASLYPAEFLGLADRRGRIAPGYAADLALLSPQIEVLGTWVDGIWESAAR